MRKLKYGQGCIVRRSYQKKDGSLSHWYQGAYKGKCVTAKTLAECEKKMSQLRRQKTVKKIAPIQSEPKPMTFEEWIVTFIKEFKKDVQPTTIKNYYSVLNNQITEEVKQMEVSKISVAALQRNINEIAITYGRSAQKLYDLLSQAVKGAYYEKLIDRDITGALKKPKYTQKEDMPVSSEDQKKILATVDPAFKDIFIAYVWTGCRVSELLTLKKSYYDREKKTLFINGTKTKLAKRTIPVFPPLAEILDKYVNLKKRNENMFCISEKTLKRWHRKAKIASGVQFTLKSLRHTFNQTLHDIGVEDVTRAAWMGHTKPATTNRVYTHNTSEQEQKAINLVNRSLLN